MLLKFQATFNLFSRKHLLYFVTSYFFLCAIINSAKALESTKLNLETFLTQVKQNHKGYQSSLNLIKAIELRSHEKEIVTSPQLSLSAQTGVDEKPTTQPLFTGTKNSQTLYSVAISQQTSFGLQGKLSYTLTHRNTEGASETMVPIPNYYLGSPTIELSQSLLRNGFGSETRAFIDSIESRNESSKLSEKFKLNLTLVEAEISYYKLLSARSRIQALEEGLSLANKFKRWTTERYVKQLGDQADLIQATAAYESRMIELQMAKSDELSARRNFNLMRGLQSEEVLELLDPPDLKFVSIVSSFPGRDDLKASEQFKKVQISQARRGYENHRATLEAYGSYGWGGLSTNSSQAVSDSFKSEHPVWGVGIRFIMPLYMSEASLTREGYLQEISISETIYQRKSEEIHKEWYELVEKIGLVQKRLELTKTLESTQKEKLKRERLRLERGRTVTAQVIQFEQDFILTSLNRIATEMELRILTAQLKLYKTE